MSIAHFDEHTQGFVGVGRQRVQILNNAGVGVLQGIQSEEGVIQSLDTSHPAVVCHETDATQIAHIESEAVA